MQGCTTDPPPLQCVADWPPKAACLVAYAAWQGEHLETVGEVDKRFGEICQECDRLVGEWGGCQHLLNWWDDNPESEVRLCLMPEIQAELNRRKFV